LANTWSLRDHPIRKLTPPWEIRKRIHITRTRGKKRGGGIVFRDQEIHVEITERERGFAGKKNGRDKSSTTTVVTWDWGKS